MSTAIIDATACTRGEYGVTKHVDKLHLICNTNTDHKNFPQCLHSLNAHWLSCIAFERCWPGSITRIGETRVAQPR